MVLSKNFKITVLLSGNGTNLQALIDAVNSGVLPEVKIVQVISNRKDAYGLIRGKDASIPIYFLEKTNNNSLKGQDENLFRILELEKPDLIVLAGYLKRVAEPVISAYKKRIINIHPSLLPKYGGPGFYGLKVHQAVLNSGDKETGATVHYVDQGMDTGRIILQEKVSVDPNDTAEEISKKVLEIEHRILVEAVKKIVDNRD